MKQNLVFKEDLKIQNLEGDDKILVEDKEGIICQRQNLKDNNLIFNFLLY